MTVDKLNKTIDTIQAGLTWFVIGVITLCIGVLFLFDVLSGTGTMLYLTNGKEVQSLVISLATTGLLFALMFMGYLMIEQKSKTVKKVGYGVLGVAFLIYLMDVVFDALLADILRYGTIMFLNVDFIQWCFRFLLGGISTVGDALAIAMIMGMPVLKKIIQSTFDTAVPSQAPAPKPTPTTFKQPGSARRAELERTRQVPAKPLVPVKPMKAQSDMDDEEDEDFEGNDLPPYVQIHRPLTQKVG